MADVAPAAVAQPPAPPRAQPRKSVSAAQGSGLGSAVKIVVRMFLEQKHYRELHRILSEIWSHCHSLTAAVRLMEAHGCHITPEEEKRLSAMPEDRMIDALVMKMPQQGREQFEHFFLQLSLIASTTTRLRSALETGCPDAIEEVLNSAENVGILQFILKMAVAQAGTEVKVKQQEHDSWLADTDARMEPLLQASAGAVLSAKKLADARSQLGSTRADANEKSKKVLMGLAGGSSTALRISSFLAWSDYTKSMKRENEVYKEYEEEIQRAEGRLLEYRMKQSKGAGGVLMRKAMERDNDLKALVFEMIKGEWEAVQTEKQDAADLLAAEAQLQLFASNQSAKSKKVLARMNDGNDKAIMEIHYCAWVEFIEDYNKDKQMNDALKLAEGRIKEFMDKQKAGASSVLTRMTAGTESGLLQTVMGGWKEVYEESKEAAKMQEILNSASGRFNEFAGRNKSNAKGAMDRAAEVVENQTLLVIIHAWKRESRIERIKRYGREKNLKKKQQLIGVKGLFKDFASELEEGLKKGTPRVEGQKKKAMPQAD